MGTNVNVFRSTLIEVMILIDIHLYKVSMLTTFIFHMCFNLQLSLHLNNTGINFFEKFQKFCKNDMIGKQ